MRVPHPSLFSSEGWEATNVNARKRVCPTAGGYSADVNGEAGNPSPLNKLHFGLFAHP